MGSTNASTPPHSLQAARVIPIAQLGPDLPDPSTNACSGVVTVTWPYNSVKSTFSFILAEPDFRLRRNKGLVQIDFTGRAAKVAGECGLASHDEVLLSLEGATWELEAADRRQSLPGASLGWRLIFSESFSFQIKRAETGEVNVVVATAQPLNQEEPCPGLTPVESLAVTKSPSPPPPMSPVSDVLSARPVDDQILKDGEFASPAFIKRARVSYGSLFEGGFDIFDEDAETKPRGRKRTKFGRDINAWRYASHSPSPEPTVESPKSVDARVSTPTRAATSPARVEMVDEGIQVMELDQSSSQPMDILQAQTDTLSTQETSDVLRPAISQSFHPMDALQAQADIISTQKVSIGPLPTDIPRSPTRQPERPSQFDSPHMEPPVEVPSTLSLGDTSASDLGTIPVPTDQIPTSVSAVIPAPSLSTMSNPPDHRPDSSKDNSADEPHDSNIVVFTSGSQSHLSHFPPSHLPSNLHINGPSSSSGREDVTYITPVAHLAESRGAIPNPLVSGQRGMESVDSRTGHLNGFNPSPASYTPVSLSENSPHNPIHTNSPYPVRYLDDMHTSQPDQITEARASVYPEVSGLNPTAWAPVNQSSLASEMAPSKRPYSRGEHKAEQIVISDDSDSTSDSHSESIASENNVDDNPVNAMDENEDSDAQYDHENDAQYADNGRFGYDDEELSNDEYAWNDQRQDDDEDDSHDNGLRIRPRKPELDDEQSWNDDDDEDERGESDEGEYESEESDAADVPPARTAAIAKPPPTVIDLISSSEDESETDNDVDEDDTMADTHQVSPGAGFRVSSDRRQSISAADHSQQQVDTERPDTIQPATSPTSSASRIHRHISDDSSSQAEEEEESADEDEYEKDAVVIVEDEEDDVEIVQDEDEDEFEDDEDRVEDDEDEVEDDEEEDGAGEDEDEEDDGEDSEDEEHGKYHDEDDEGGGESQLIKDEDEREEDQELSKNGNEPGVTEPEPTSISERPRSRAEEEDMESKSGLDAEADGQIAPDNIRDPDVISSQAEMPYTTDVATTGEKSEDGPTNIPFSAADGLEILSRSIDRESTITNAEVIDSLRDNGPLARHFEQDDVQMQDVSNHYDATISEATASGPHPTDCDGGRKSDPKISLKPDATQGPSSEPNKGTSVAAARFSPPSTQSVQPSRAEENASVGLPKAAINVAAEIATGLLPTPQSSQIAEGPRDPTASTQIKIVESSELQTGIESKGLGVGKVPRVEDTADGPSYQDIDAHEDHIGIERPGATTSTSKVQGQESRENSSTFSSPAHSFASQVDDGQPTSSEIDSEEKHDDQLSQNVEFEHNPSSFGTKFFASHMEVDDELQASIWRNFELEEDPSYELTMPPDANADENDPAETSSRPRIGMGFMGQVMGSGMDTSSSLQEDTLERQVSVQMPTQNLPNIDTEMGITERSETWPVKTSAYLARLSLASKKARPEAKKNTGILTPQRAQHQTAENVSMQAKNVIEGRVTAEDSDIWSDSPSAYLARFSLASRRPKSQGRWSTGGSDTASLRFSRGSFGRASFGSQASRFDEDNSSMAAAKLQLSRHLRDELFDCASLKVLRQHLTKSLDVIAVAMMHPPAPRRAKGGPREFMMSFTISDHSIGPHGVAEVLIYRPYRDTLPEIKYGDIVLLRNFTVVSLANKGFGLRSNASSSWAVFDYEDEPAQVRGPPVEYGETEVLYVGYLREWFRLLDARAFAYLERANKNIINAREPEQASSPLGKIRMTVA